MANHIMRASHGLTLPEKRTIAAALAKSDTTDGRALQDERFWTVKISAAEYAETFQVTCDTAYEQLQQAANGLLTKLIEENKEAPRGTVRVVKHQWLMRAVYAKGEGSVTITWHPDLRPFVFCLRGEFTTYKLKHAAALRSVYSWRLFECLRSWSSVGKWAPTIEEFWAAMDAKPAHRANFKALRQRIIEPAVEELTKKNGLEIAWQPVKKGRRVAALKFKFERSQGALF